MEPSIFDSITTPTQATAYGSSTPVAGGPPAASTVAIWSTGIIASVESEQFEQLVRDAVEPVVLRTATPGPVNAGVARKLHRYVFSCAGIVFVTQTGKPLHFSNGVREVECLGVLCDGKPIGRNDGTVV